jgi:hypothetical protein
MNGSVEAELVYVNYGTAEDFALLEAAGVALAGRIGIARYGMNARNVKALLATERRMAAVLLYSDPADDGFARGAVYPDGPWRPPASIQRGSAGQISIYTGDPLTPGTSPTSILFCFYSTIPFYTFYFIPFCTIQSTFAGKHATLLLSCRVCQLRPLLSIDCYSAFLPTELMICECGERRSSVDSRCGTIAARSIERQQHSGASAFLR